MNGSRLVTGTISPTGTTLGGATPGLSGFSLEFRNGDHHIGWIGAGARTYSSSEVSADDFLLVFSDRDYGVAGSESGDPVEMWARYRDLEPLGRPGDDPPPGYRPDGPRRRLLVGGRGRGTTRVTMPALPRDMLFVLCGFSFRTSGSNHNLLALAVAPSPYDGFIDVTYRDNDGNDDYSCEVSYSAVPHRSRTGRGPQLPLYFEGPFEASLNFRGSGTAAREHGDALLQGFRMEFQNGDHHLLKCAVDLAGPAAPPRASNPRLAVTFRDGDGGDPVQASVQYIVGRADIP